MLTLVGGVVVLAVAAATLALWEGRAVMLLLFLAYTLGAAMRPGVDSLVRVGVPRALALAGHFALFFAVIALLLWLIVPVGRPDATSVGPCAATVFRHRSGSCALRPQPGAELARIEARRDLGAEHR